MRYIDICMHAYVYVYKFKNDINQNTMDEETVKQYIFSLFISKYRLRMYKFLRDVIFEVFTVNWSSLIFLSSKCY